jgi:hypothetical protein
MPNNLRERFYYSFSTGLGSQSESEQPVHVWNQGFWYQQQVEEDTNCLDTNECTSPDEMDTKPSRTLAFKSESLSLTLPPITESPEWVNRRVRQSFPDGLPRYNGSLDGWAATDYWTSSLFNGMQGTSSLFAPLRTAATMIQPSCGTDSSNQIEYLSTASSESSHPIVSAEEGENSAGPRSAKEATPIRSLITSLLTSPELNEAPKRKRGRPRIVREEIPDSSSANSRVPHNQVEQKYRNGLNAELERLRETVSTQMQHGKTGSGKLSKAMVLSGAIECIRIMEATRDDLENENKGLRRYNKKLRREKKMAADR